jgi:hypothetical protein
MALISSNPRNNDNHQQNSSTDESIPAFYRLIELIIGLLFLFISYYFAISMNHMGN